MSATVVIPARLGSTRFPEKMLAHKTGKPLVQHVVDQVKSCRRVARVIVATDHARIAQALSPFGTTVAMTDPNHPSGTDRIAEVARRLGDDVSAGILVNVQGDEPEIDPELVDQLIERLETSQDQMVTAAVRFPKHLDVNNPNHVKVVVSSSNASASFRAIYFSRWPVPYVREMTETPVGHLLHLGIYGYRKSFLLQYASWRPTPLEQAEKLEQLRAIEHGVSIGVVVVEQASSGIDTPEQYEEFVKRFKQAT
jgi:3-deoxy-manno-octulosonate cytidylyltransferase (CMP-KDO synthetase)